jgi:hypothetical protein
MFEKNKLRNYVCIVCHDRPSAATWGADRDAERETGFARREQPLPQKLRQRFESSSIVNRRVAVALRAPLTMRFEENRNPGHAMIPLI